MLWAGTKRVPHRSTASPCYARPAVHSCSRPSVQSEVAVSQRALPAGSVPLFRAPKTETTCTITAFTRTYPQALDWISETGYLLRQTVSPVALAGEERFHFPRDLVHRLMIRLARQANLLYADGFSIDPYRCWK